MSSLPQDILIKLIEVLSQLASSDNAVRATAEDQLDKEWMFTKPDTLLTGLAFLSRNNSDPEVTTMTTSTPIFSAAIPPFHSSSPLPFFFLFLSPRFFFFEPVLLSLLLYLSSISFPREIFARVVHWSPVRPCSFVPGSRSSVCSFCWPIDSSHHFYPLSFLAACICSSVDTPSRIQGFTK